MSISAERIALADHAVLRTFEQTSVAWQAIPHWDTQNPGQTRVRADVVFALEPRDMPIPLEPEVLAFPVTLAQATAPNPDGLLGAVIAQTVGLAHRFDAAVLEKLVERAAMPRYADWYVTAEPPREPDGSALTAGDIADDLLGRLLDGRAKLEDNGYRAGSCLLAGEQYFRALNRLVGGVVVADEVMRGGAVKAAYRVGRETMDPARMVLIGRRQDMPGGLATHASAGEEPVDLAVSVPPSIEVIGDNPDGTIELAVRLRYALRVKDDQGVVIFSPPAPVTGPEPGPA